MQQSNSKREVYSNISKHQEKHQIEKLTLHLKQLEKEEEKKPKISRRKEIIKIRAEINEIEMKKTVPKINETKSQFFEKMNKITISQTYQEKRERNK